MTKKGQREVLHIENAYGGKGHILKEHLINETELGAHCGLFGRITIPVNCELGYHDHIGETETYYILEGQGDYDQNGTTISVTEGDVIFCPDGEGHGLVNTGIKDIVLMAVILKN